MYGKDKFDQFLAKNPYPKRLFINRPHLSRRRFFEVLGAGVTGSYLINAGRAQAQEIESQASVAPVNKAKNVIFILLAGAPSHTDTFDFKQSPDTPMDMMKPDTIKGLAWPVGVLPKLATNLDDIAIVRSMRSWALVHNLAQTWTQIGRNPAAALGSIAPNIGSIVAAEKASERKPGQVFPTFLGLNSDNGVGSGYMSANYAPFRVNAPAAAAQSGLRDTTNPDGPIRMDDRWSELHQLDDPLRVNSPYGKPLEDMDDFYTSARGLMYNPVVDSAFKFSAADSMKYGGTGFGNACLIAKQVLASNQGTRYIQITVGGWDMHQNIYGQNNSRSNILTLGNQLDSGVSALLTDLKAAGSLNETMVVMAGEFGRTTGKVTMAGGRDHFVQQFVFLPAAGIKGGRAIGSTDATGSATLDPGWSRARDVRPEDIEATIYSALGIDWSKIRYDDPFGRGFEYVPFSKDNLYGPVNELWGA